MCVNGKVPVVIVAKHIRKSDAVTSTFAFRFFPSDGGP